MLSPVDGVDEIGLIKNFCVIPGKKLNFDLPTLIIPAGLDSVPGNKKMFTFRASRYASLKIHCHNFN